MAQQRFKLAYGNSVKLTAPTERGFISVRLEAKGGKLFKTIAVSESVAAKFSASLAELVSDGTLIPLGE